MYYLAYTCASQGQVLTEFLSLYVYQLVEMYCSHVAACHTGGKITGYTRNYRNSRGTDVRGL